MLCVDKIVWKPSTLLYPLPVVMVSCQYGVSLPNIITIAWTGTICSAPPMVSISVRPERYSHELIARAQEFVVNVPSVAQAWATDYCGVVSGRSVDKFAKTGLTPGPSTTVSAPIITECPLNIECRVQKTMELGTHTIFMADVVGVQATADLMTADNRLALEKAGLITYAHGHYYALGRSLGHFGFSVKKKGSPRQRTVSRRQKVR